ncbi:MAG: glycosyltransferase family 39 protein [Nitrospirota bacterium]|nr:glycosyltransferase family 39 protein [Nitrospirota bacterium]
MDTDQSDIKTAPYFLIISFFTLATPVILYSIRFLDDNRLTRWQWVFADINAFRVFLLLIPVIIIAYGLSKVSFFDHNPLFLFISSFMIAAVFWSEPEVIVDTSRYFTQAKHLELYGFKYFFNEWGGNILAWTDLPLIPFLYGIILKVFGEQRIYIQAFTTLLFSLSVVLTYLIGRTLWDEDTGFYAGLLMLGVPYLFVQIPFMMVDVPTMFFLTLSIFTFLMAMEYGGAGWIISSAIAIFLVFFCKYSTWPMLSVLCIILLVYLRKDWRGPLLRSSVIALLAGLLISVVILLKFDFFLGQIKFLFSYQMPGLRRWGETFASTFLFQINPFITAAALYSLYVAFRKKDMKYLIISYLILLVLLFQIRRIRYVIPLLPMLTLMASYGLRNIRAKEVRKFIVFCVIGSSLVLAISVYLPFLQKYSTVNLREAGRYLDSLEIGDAEVFTLPQKRSFVNPAVAVPILDLFTDRKLLYNYEVNKRFGRPIPAERVKKSSLRFTWLYRNPVYYRSGLKKPGQAGAVVVISQRVGQPLPGYVRKRVRGYHLSRVFSTATGVFRYRTIVKVYERNRGAK